MRFRLFLLATILTLPSLALGGPQDREIAEQIAGSLRASGQLRAYNIRVKVEDGTAWLRGRVANERQMNAAIALAFQAKGVEQVANGLTIRTDLEPQQRLAPLASHRPVAPAVERARPAPSPPVPMPAAAPTRAPVPTRAPAPLAPAVSPPSPASLAAAGDLAADPVVRQENMVEQASALVGDWPSGSHTAVEALRNPDFVSIGDAPFTAQKASYYAVVGQAHPMDHHMANLLAGVSEPILLPGSSGSAAGEAFVCDESDTPPTLLPADCRQPPVAEDSGGDLTLIQTLPEPTRRTWAGGFRQRGEPRMQALLED